MSGLKEHLQFVGQSKGKVTPDEIDRYEVYTVVNPGIQTSWWGTAAVSGTSDTKAFVIVNAMPDYPRSMSFTIGAAGSLGTISGTAVVNGKDQFGNVITETITAGAGTNTATGNGTKVFSRFISGTCTYGTNSALGTPSLGFVSGTSSLFGLPTKIGGTADIVHYGYTYGGTATTVNGGTIGSFANDAMHAFRPAAAITGTISEVFTVWYKPSHDNASKANMTGMNQSS